MSNILKPTTLESTLPVVEDIEQLGDDALDELSSGLEEGEEKDE